MISKSVNKLSRRAGVLYSLLRPVSRHLSLASAFARLGEAVVQAVNLMTAMMAPTPHRLGSSPYMSGSGEPEKTADQSGWNGAHGFHRRDRECTADFFSARI